MTYDAVHYHAYLVKDFRTEICENIDAEINADIGGIGVGHSYKPPLSLPGENP